MKKQAEVILKALGTITTALEEIVETLPVSGKGKTAKGGTKSKPVEDEEEEEEEEEEQEYDFDNNDEEEEEEENEEEEEEGDDDEGEEEEIDEEEEEAPKKSKPKAGEGKTSSTTGSTKVSFEEVTTVLQKLQKKFGTKGAAKVSSLLKKHGAASTRKLDPKKYALVLKDAKAMIK